MRRLIKGESKPSTDSIPDFNALSKKYPLPIESESCSLSEYETNIENPSPLSTTVVGNTTEAQLSAQQPEEVLKSVNAIQQITQVQPIETPITTLANQLLEVLTYPNNAILRLLASGNGAQISPPINSTNSNILQSNSSSLSPQLFSPAFLLSQSPTGCLPSAASSSVLNTNVTQAAITQLILQLHYQQQINNLLQLKSSIASTNSPPFDFTTLTAEKPITFPHQT
jgi:hypothetical protein